MNRPLFITWNKSNETGFAHIDEQHRGIISVINTFHSMMNEAVENPSLYGDIIYMMKNYSRVHFMMEEGFLKVMEYEDIEHHKRLHQKLILEMAEVEYEAIKESDPRILLDFLKFWWLNHINKEDQLYARRLRARSA